MRTACPRLIFSALRGNSGKTLLSVGFSAYLRREGKKITAFKKGPDYIDAAWLMLASGSPCYNLDYFIMERDNVLARVAASSADSEFAVIEGNRGLFDGYDLKGSYSTAELSKMLHTPVILILDCTKITRTIAATVLGCQHFDPDVPLQGVILNRVAGTRHESIITAVIEERCNIPVIGSIPKIKGFTFPERHMGLVPPQEHHGSTEAVEKAADIVEKYVNTTKLMEIAQESPPLEVENSNSFFTENTIKNSNQDNPRIGYLKDSAFWFYYPDNIEALEKLGAQMIPCNSLNQDTIPELDALYIGGGFPETHADVLSDNVNFRNSIKAAIESGLPVYAECGGLVYLGEKLIVEDKEYSMVGSLPLVFDLKKRPQGHGYTIAKTVQPNTYFPEGTVLFGHEFHYSRVVNEIPDIEKDLVFLMEKGNGIIGKKDGIVYKNVLATYSHIHALGTGGWAQGFYNNAVSHKNKKFIMQ